MKVLEFARSTILFRIDLDVLPPRTLSHKPPFAMNNARIQIDSVCRITERAGGRRHTFVLGGDCKTERVGAERGPVPRSQRRLHPDLLRRRVHAHQDVRARRHAGAGVPARLGRAERPTHARRSPTRSSTPTWTSSSARASCWPTARRSSSRSWPTTSSSASTGSSTDRYDVEIEYPAKTINANERDIVYQTDTGPILWPDLERDPADLLTGLELAFTAANAPDWAQIIVRRRTSIADGVEVYHYADSIRVEGIANEFYRLPDSAPGDPGGSTCSARRLAPVRPREGPHEDHRHRVPRHRLRHRRGLGRHHARGHPLDLVRVLLRLIHTDEGIDGYTMQNANVRDGGAMVHVLHDLYAPQVIGEDPLASEALWHKLRRLNRHAYNLSDGIAGAIDVGVWDIRGKAVGLPVAKMLGLAREKIPAYATARNIEPTPEQVFEEAQGAQGAGLPRVQDPVLGRARSRHPALPGGARGGR